MKITRNHWHAETGGPIDGWQWDSGSNMWTTALGNIRAEVYRMKAGLWYWNLWSDATTTRGRVTCAWDGIEKVHGELKKMKPKGAKK
jgi:hypothetical protein